MPEEHVREEPERFTVIAAATAVFPHDRVELGPIETGRGWM